MRTKLMAIIAVMLMSISCMSISAYAFTGEKEQPTEVTETATPIITEETDKSVNDSVQSNSAFTPKGNMGLVDDVVQDSETDEEGNYVGKQFITVESKNGNTFYIIIDRDGKNENVYFLNAVDEADLLALMEEEQQTAYTAVCTCTDKCEAGAVDENCPVCAKDKSKCAGIEKVSDDKAGEDEQKEESKSTSSAPALIIVLLLAAGGGYYAYKKFKDKKSAPVVERHEEDDEEDESEDEPEQISVDEAYVGEDDIEDEIADDGEDTDDKESEDDEE